MKNEVAKQAIQDLVQSKQQLRAKLEALRDSADLVVSDFYSATSSLGRKAVAARTKRNGEKGRGLTVRVRLYPDANSLTITWRQTTGWSGKFGQKFGPDKRRGHYDDIPHRTRGGYSMRQLMRLAPPWQARLVYETELALAPYRREAYALAEMSRILSRAVTFGEHWLRRATAEAPDIVPPGDTFQPGTYLG